MTDPILEAEARILFESDSSSKWEASWDNLASYKRWAWIDMAYVARLRRDKEFLDIDSQKD